MTEFDSTITTAFYNADINITFVYCLCEIKTIKYYNTCVALFQLLKAAVSNYIIIYSF